MTAIPSAMRNLAHLLKTEDDLDKVEHLKAQLQTEKSSIEVQLKNITQIQLDSFLHDMERLSLCQDDVKELKENTDKISALATESFGAISRYELINEITHVHEIFEQSTQIAGNISQFNSMLQEVDNMIEREDYQSVYPSSDVAGLLPIHYKLNQLLDFQDQILELAKRSTDDSQFTVKRLTSRTDPIVKKFDTLLGNIVEIIVEAVREENFSLVVRMAKIIDFEDISDQKIETIKKLFEGKRKDKKGDRTLFDHIVNGTVEGRTEPRRYKELFLAKIADGVKDTFKNCWDVFEGKGNVFEVLENLDWIFNDLATIQQDLTTLMPPKWDIFRIYYEIYYSELHKIIVKLIELEPETAIILEILQFDEDFQMTMKDEFGLKKADLKTIIGEPEKEQLLSDYLNLIVAKMNEWIGKVETNEHDVFKKRIQAPDADSEGLLAMEGTRMVFQMFTQQCELAQHARQGKVVAGVISAFAELLMKRQQNWSDLVKLEVQRLLASNNHQESKTKDGNEEVVEEPVPAGLIEYLTALANDQMRSADHTEAISNKYAAMVSKVYATKIHTDLEVVIDGFANLAKQCCDALIVIIFDDLKVVMDLIFSKNWANSNYSQQISDTLYEYLGDLKTSMNNYLFEILSEEILEECILRYLNNLNNDVKFPKTTEKLLTCVKRDFEVFYKLFIQFLDQGIIESKFKIVENFMDLSAEPDLDQILAHWKSTLDNFPDIKPEFLSLVLKARRDVDSSDAKLVVPRAKDIQRQFLQENTYFEPTFMGRFSLSMKLKKNYL